MKEELLRTLEEIRSDIRNTLDNLISLQRRKEMLFNVIEKIEKIPVSIPFVFFTSDIYRDNDSVIDSIISSIDNDILVLIYNIEKDFKKTSTFYERGFSIPICNNIDKLLSTLKEQFGQDWDILVHPTNKYVSLKIPIYVPAMDIGGGRIITDVKYYFMFNLNLNVSMENWSTSMFLFNKHSTYLMSAGTLTVSLHNQGTIHRHAFHESTSKIQHGNHRLCIGNSTFPSTARDIEHLIGGDTTVDEETLSVLLNHLQIKLSTTLATPTDSPTDKFENYGLASFEFGANCKGLPIVQLVIQDIIVDYFSCEFFKDGVILSEEIKGYGEKMLEDIYESFYALFYNVIPIGKTPTEYHEKFRANIYQRIYDKCVEEDSTEFFMVTDQIILASLKTIVGQDLVDSSYLLETDRNIEQIIKEQDCRIKYSYNIAHNTVETIKYHLKDIPTIIKDIEKRKIPYHVKNFVSIREKVITSNYQRMVNENIIKKIKKLTNERIEENKKWIEQSTNLPF